MTDRKPSGPRCAALVGPYLSGKTTLLENILFVTGAINRRGTIKEGNTVGDSSPESRQRKMSVEITAATTEFLGESWTFLDCPGSIELQQDSYNALLVCDVAVIVVEPIAERARALAPLFKFLDDREIPHMVFVNKMDHPTSTVREVLEALQAVSSRPLVMRQVPIIANEAVTGYVDLVSERAYRYKAGQASDLIAIPDSDKSEEQSQRQKLLEALADFDDTLLEKLLEDTVPPTDEIYTQLTKNFQTDRIVPLFLGAAERESGVRRLLKALRHETPESRSAAARLGVDSERGEALAQVFKTYHMPHTGKLSLARVWRGEIADGATLNDERVSGLLRLVGQQQTKLAKAGPGMVVALGRMEKTVTGTVLTPSGKAPAGMAAWPKPLAPVYGVAIHAENRNDEVKISGALARLVEEDPSLSSEHRADTHQLILWGQGEIQLQIAADRLKNKFNLVVKAQRPDVPYKETIRRAVSQHARHKKQSGGHGQFGDVHVDIKPLPRGGGFTFHDKIVGGAVPRQFIPSVEIGVKDYLQRGPLGFNVVDLEVSLTDGQYHSVDSSDMAFRTAARLAMSEGMPKCEPVLLEPILKVTISAPTEFTANVQRLITGRRGQILGFQPKDGWKGWDETSAFIPQKEVSDLIIELRSLTVGVGTFEWQFDHLQELTGRLADEIVQKRHQPPAAS
ncbi:MAG: elongation factor G [Alphaproteobacteria bacterium]